MYSYIKEKKSPKRRLIASLNCLLTATTVFLTYEYSMKSPTKDTSVFKGNATPVPSLPNSAEEEEGIQPFAVKVGVVLDYFDGKNNKIDSMTEFENVYRANQSVDYSFNKEAFDILASFSGEANGVKEDNIFDKSVTIASRDLSIAYQSLSGITVKKGDKVDQKGPIARTGSNIYNKELDNRLHTAVEKNGKIMDPKLIYDKTNAEIKQCSCGTIFICEGPSIHIMRP